MGRVYKYIRSIKLQKVLLKENELGPEYTITDPVVIQQFRHLVEDAPRCKLFMGNLEAPRYFIRVFGPRDTFTRGFVQPRYAYFNNQWLHLPHKELWELVEQQVASTDG